MEVAAYVFARFDWLSTDLSPDYDYLIPRYLILQPASHTQNITHQGVDHFTVGHVSPTFHSESWPPQVAQQLDLNVRVATPSLGQTTQYVHNVESRESVSYLFGSQRSYRADTFYAISQAPGNNLDAWHQFTNIMQTGSNIGPVEPGSISIRESYSANTIPQTRYTCGSNPEKSNLDTVSILNAAQPPAGSIAISTTLTPASLALNDECLPPSEFPYAIYQGEDSGYQSLEHARVPEIETPAEHPWPPVSSASKLPETTPSIFQPQFEFFASGKDHSHNYDPQS